jgi:cytochrome c biogenesis protein CcmG/thiol:disulfide interchange protein DsbE
MPRFLIPLVVFIALVAVLAVGLTRDPRLVPSPLVDKAAPAFILPTVADPGREIGIEDLKGQVALLNVWASWCIACREEHPFLMELAQEQLLPIYGLDYKDLRPDAQRWLAQFGNPYLQSAFDEQGRVGIDWGVYGVPETFLLDADGFIRYKHIGPLNREIWERDILPLVRRLKEENA